MHVLQKYFNDEFYETEEGEQKPAAPEDIEDLQCGKMTAKLFLGLHGLKQQQNAGKCQFYL